MNASGVMKRFDLRVAVSNSHVHLSTQHTMELFGRERLEGVADIGHPRYQRSAAMVTLFGPMRSLEVVVLAPASDETWVELNRTHAFTLGVTPPHGHGPLAAGSITIVGPRGRITLTKNVRIEQRHIEISAEQAAQYGVQSGQLVCADIGGARGALLRNVQVRIVDAKEGFTGFLQLDRDEANALCISHGDSATIVVD